MAEPNDATPDLVDLFEQGPAYAPAEPQDPAEPWPKEPITLYAAAVEIAAVDFNDRGRPRYVPVSDEENVDATLTEFGF